VHHRLQSLSSEPVMHHGCRNPQWWRRAPPLPAAHTRQAERASGVVVLSLMRLMRLLLPCKMRANASVLTLMGDPRSASSARAAWYTSLALG
jgi:hypothetical protein